MNLSFLRHFLFSGDPSDLHKISRVIEEKCVHPHIQIKKITASSKLNGNTPHPLYIEKTLDGHSNYGIFSTKRIKTGTEIGEYVGELSLKRDLSEINFDQMPFSQYRWILSVNNFIIIVDAKNIANEIGLINDYRGIRSKPNVKMQPIIHKGTCYFGYVSVCDILEGEELVVDYGENFWKCYNSIKRNSSSLN